MKEEEEEDKAKEKEETCRGGAEGGRTLIFWCTVSYILFLLLHLTL